MELAERLVKARKLLKKIPDGEVNILDMIPGNTVPNRMAFKEIGGDWPYDQHFEGSKRMDCEICQQPSWMGPDTQSSRRFLKVLEASTVDLCQICATLFMAVMRENGDGVGVGAMSGKSMETEGVPNREL